MTLHHVGITDAFDYHFAPLAKLLDTRGGIDNTTFFHVVPAAYHDENSMLSFIHEPTSLLDLDIGVFSGGLVASRWHEELLSIAKRRMPLAYMQRSCTDPSWAGESNRKLVAGAFDYVTAMSSRDARSVADYLDIECRSILITGVPFLDALSGVAKRARSADTVLVTPGIGCTRHGRMESPIATRLLFDTVEHLRNRRPEISIVVRPHPRTSPDERQQWARLGQLDESPFSIKAMVDAGVVVGLPGSVWAAAVACRVPIVGVVAASEPCRDAVNLDLASQVVRAPEQIHDAIEEATPASEYVVNDVVGPLDGLAGKRVVDAMCAFARQELPTFANAPLGLS